MKLVIYKFVDFELFKFDLFLKRNQQIKKIQACYVICTLNKLGKNMKEILFYNLDIILFLEFYLFILLDILYFIFIILSIFTYYVDRLKN